MNATLELKEIYPRYCDVRVETTGHINKFSYHICGRLAKYRIRYADPVSGKSVERCVCGIHFRGAEKSAASLKKRMGYDAKFESELLASHRPYHSDIKDE